jgi:hypothetical protein
MASCESCSATLVSTRAFNLVSSAGAIGVLVVVSGLLRGLAMPVAGLITVIAGLFICIVGGRTTIMICPRRGKHGGADSPSNTRCQTKGAARAKEKVE